MPKRATQVVLSEKEQEALTRISRRYRSAQQVAQRARIILAAAQGQSNAQIARELAINVTVPRRIYSNSRRRTWPGCIGKSGCLRSTACTPVNSSILMVRSPCLARWGALA